MFIWYYNLKHFIMNSTISKVLRFLLGIAMIIFGANKFAGFMPKPELSEKAGILMGALADSGYIFPILGVFYIIIGLLLVVNKAVPLALIMLVPISINIVAFHLVLDPKGVLFAAIVAILNAILLFNYSDKFKTLFK